MDRYSFLLGKGSFPYGIHIFVDVSDLRHGRFFGTHLFINEGASADGAGGVYMLCIFSAEYLSGWGLQRVVGLCPWNYSDSHFQINGLIRLDYAPLWFGVGLLFEGLFFRLV